MSHAFHPVKNRFFVNDSAGSKIHRYLKPFPDQRLQHFHLHFPHKLGLDFLKFLVAANMKLWFFLLQKF